MSLRLSIQSVTTVVASMPQPDDMSTDAASDQEHGSAQMVSPVVVDPNVPPPKSPTFPYDPTQVGQSLPAAASLPAIAELLLKCESINPGPVGMSLRLYQQSVATSLAAITSNILGRLCPT